MKLSIAASLNSIFWWAAFSAKKATNFSNEELQREK